MSNEFVNASVAAGFGGEARTLIAALERIVEWVCYASEEDTSAKPLALQQIGLAAREALATVGESTKPTPAPGQCPTCGEYSMSARAMQGLYGTTTPVGG